MAIRTWSERRQHAIPHPHDGHRAIGWCRLVWAWRVLSDGYTVAEVDDVEEARACVRELVDVGVPPADVQLATADKAIEIHRRQRGGARLLDRIIGALPTDGSSIQDEYLIQADEGSQFVVVRSRGKDQEARARRVLAGHGARRVRHYGRWTWEEASQRRACSFAAGLGRPRGPRMRTRLRNTTVAAARLMLHRTSGCPASLPARRKWRVVIQNRAKRYGGLRTAVTHMPGPRPVQ
jgi:hypothetical protein